MRHRILSMLCETAEAFGKSYQYDPQPQIQALKNLIFAENLDNMYQVSEAMTTANFPLLMGTVLDRALMKQYELRRSPWRSFVYNDSTPDFRLVDRFRTTRPGTLIQRGEMGESEVTHITESMLSYGVAEFARTFELNWRVLVNDDLGALNNLVSDMHEAALVFEDMFVNGLYDTAAVQAALVMLGAQYSGAGVLSEANLEIGVNAMRTRQDPVGNLIVPDGIWLIIPPELEFTAIRIMQTPQTLGTPNNDVNVVRRFVNGYIVDPYIATAPGAAPWYLIANPSARYNTITVTRLDGYGDTPKLWLRTSDRQPISAGGAVSPAAAWGGSWMSKAIEIEVEDIIGGWDDATWGGVTNFRGLYYSSGTN